MLTITNARDFIQANLCYQLFITPVHMPLEKQYRFFAARACEFFAENRTASTHIKKPRHHVIHRFRPVNKKNTKKILITHGWMSRAAYMVRLTQSLHQQGYDVFSLDFPAHGEARGLQLPWTDAVIILKNIINKCGPFHAVIGHSFGGSMLLNCINLAGQLPEWQLNSLPEYAIMIASPTRFKTPIRQMAKKFNLNNYSYKLLLNTIYEKTDVDIQRLSIEQFYAQKINIPFLCLHGENDTTINPNESIFFCNRYQNGTLELLPDATHVSVLMDERVEERVLDFLG